MSEEKKVQDKYARVTSNSAKFLSAVDDSLLENPMYIPDSLQPYVNQFVRESRKRFDLLRDSMENFSKSSDQYIRIQKEIESVANSLFTVRKQIDKYTKGVVEMSKIMPNMSKGTQDSNYYINSAIFGNQWDNVLIDEQGKFSFELIDDDDVVRNIKKIMYNPTSTEQKDINTDRDFVSGYSYDGAVMGSPRKTRKEGQKITLDDIAPIQYSSAPIIQEPYAEKLMVYNMVQALEEEKKQGKKFNDIYIYNNLLTKFTDAGANRVIGTAFADLAGDGRTQSFAEMWESGLKDRSLYMHPDNGEKMPKDSIWMKDPANADVLSKLLSKHVVNTLNSLYGTIDVTTGQVVRSDAPRRKLSTKELLEKYS